MPTNTSNATALPATTAAPAAAPHGGGPPLVAVFVAAGIFAIIFGIIVFRWLRRTSTKRAADNKPAMQSELLNDMNSDDSDDDGPSVAS
jgi:hypothetical protein